MADVLLTGLAAVGATSLVVNQPMKMIGERRRPRPERTRLPQQRWVTMPSSTSFVRSLRVRRRARRCRRKPAAGAQASVAWRSVGRSIFPRIHRRPYPSDVLVGATVGALLGLVASTVVRRARGRPRHDGRSLSHRCRVTSVRPRVSRDSVSAEDDLGTRRSVQLQSTATTTLHNTFGFIRCVVASVNEAVNGHCAEFGTKRSQVSCHPDQ
jgi:hypothetical protein